MLENLTISELVKSWMHTGARSVGKRKASQPRSPAAPQPRRPAAPRPCPQASVKRALDEQCKGGFGAPQGPLGEIYSTHTTVGGMTWRYVVGVQVAANAVWV